MPMKPWQPRPILIHFFEKVNIRKSKYSEKWIFRKNSLSLEKFTFRKNSLSPEKLNFPKKFTFPPKKFTFSRKNSLSEKITFPEFLITNFFMFKNCCSEKWMGIGRGRHGSTGQNDSYETKLTKRNLEFVGQNEISQNFAKRNLRSF